MREFQIGFITNPVTVRWVRILNLIEREHAFTLIHLSEQLNITQRTLIKDIQALKDHFGKSASFHSGRNGHRFEEVDRLLYKERKEQLLENEVLFEIIGNIFYGELRNVGDLAYDYNYAESTLRRFLAQLQSSLNDYGLTLNLNPVTIVGDEGSIRKFFFDFYYGGEHNPHTIRPPEGLHQMILQELKSHFEEIELGSGMTVTAFYYVLYITMVRVQQNHFISLPNWIKEINQKENDFQLLYSLVPLIEKEYGVCLPKEEVSWIHLYILCNRPIDEIQHEKLFYERFNQWPEISNVAKNYFSSDKYDSWNRELLEAFLSAYLVARRINEAICPELNKELFEEREMVKKNYSETYLENDRFLRKNQKRLGLADSYFEDIVNSFTLYIDLLIHYYQPVRTILFLIEGDYLVVQSIRLKATRMLGNQHQVIFMPLKGLTKERLESEHVDLVVTNYRPYLFDYVLKKEPILMNPIPDSKDWERVLDQINPFIDRMTSEIY
ncbi:MULTISPECIES: helix-turn-helix domain-containing protein [Enterococcus]|uniref:helix-turn-helix domain-containing protein n=1 Tax=Enterococcus TaxID=1350 RepID=UPI00031E5293|nr:helix-turn-helix domain-containing protein [Enterococcus mundtii]MDB7100564.1 helix-turn-helix domain-containing protein [Enterococcus mundtii]OBS62211.1 M protein trans-acting positive regulator [Enterococcus mundtii]PQC33174.1 PRD domain-containing protein [Enterococcus mundtii]PTO41204.1 PRD domain-containing protein [Enterococcus mundtii]